MDLITDDTLPPPSTATSPTRMRDALLRRPFHALVPFALVTGGIFASSYLVEPTYESSTLILVERDRVPESFVPNITGDESDRRLPTIRQEILSRTRLEKILTELDPYPETERRVPRIRLVERMRDAVTIAVKGNDAFSVQFAHRDPHMAMQVADRLTTLFIEETLRAQEGRTAEATQFIESQLEDARRELETREEALRRFKEQHMGTLPGQTGANLATLQRLQMEQQAIATNLQAALDRLSALELTPPDVPATLSELDRLRTELMDLRRRYTDEHPEVQALTARIERLEQQPSAPAPEKHAAGALAAQITEARQDVQRLKARSKSVDRRIAEVQARVDQAPRTEQELATLTRDFQKLNENYLTLLNKKLDAQMAQRLEERWQGERFRILDPAYLPERPISPRRGRYAAVGVFLGLLAGLGLALGMELLDPTIRDSEELRTLQAYPILACIPHIPNLGATSSKR
jgi:polysaccharide chain length determinant protein (PEP-CTERM system associated)